MAISGRPLMAVSGRALAAWRGPQLRGPLAVGAGTAVLGASGYLYLTLAAGAVSPADYAGLAALYLLVALVGPALSMPFDQETTRLVSRAGALGQGIRPLVGRLARLAAIQLCVALALLLAARPWLLAHEFNGRESFWWALVASVVGCSGAYLLRGVLAGQRRFGAFGAVVAADGLARIVPCIAVIALQDEPAGRVAVVFALALGSGPIVSFLVALATSRLAGAGPVPSWSSLTRAMGSLLAAWGLSLIMANIAPIVVTALMPQDRALAGLFAFTFVLARIPLFVLFAAQPLLLPMLTHAVTRRDHAALVGALRRAGVLVGALGVATLIGTPPLCLWLTGVLFGDGQRLPLWVVIGLAGGTVLAIVVQGVQPALLAASSHRLIAVAWLAGTICFAVAFLLPVQPITAAVLAQLVSGVATLTVMAVALRARLAAQVTPEAASAPALEETR